MRPLLAAALSGLLWAAPFPLVFSGAADFTAAAAWAYALVVGPAVGVAVYLLSRRQYARPGRAGFGWSLLTVATAGLVFILPAVILIAPAGEAADNVLQVFGAVLFWTVFLPPFWLFVAVLWMLAFANHQVMSRLYNRSGATGRVV